MSRLAMMWLVLGVLIVAGISETQSRLLSAARGHSSVQIEQNDVFVYRYTIENGAGSTAGISRMTIDISLPMWGRRRHRLRDLQSVVGITLAPTAPVTLTADGLLANLAKEVAHARALRWISNDTSARHIAESLQAARAMISRKQLDAAASILNELRKEVAAQSGKALTSEAVLPS